MFYISPSALVLLAMIIYFISPEMILAYFAAVLMHELGHIAALYICGKRPENLYVSLFGFEMSYQGSLTNLNSIVCSAAGPVSGLLYALLLYHIPAFRRVPAAEYSAGISFVLSIFNLLPALPLDGAEILCAMLRMFFSDGKTQKVLKASSVISSVFLIVAGLIRNDGKFAFGLLFAGLMLLIYIILPEGIVKKTFLS